MPSASRSFAACLASADESNRIESNRLESNDGLAAVERRYGPVAKFYMHNLPVVSIEEPETLKVRERRVHDRTLSLLG